MQGQTIESMAKNLPPFEPGKRSSAREHFFAKVVEWGGYTSEEYPFEDGTRQILETVLKMHGDDRIDCVISLLSNVEFDGETKEKALKEMEKILDKGQFGEFERQRLDKKIFDLRKKGPEKVFIP